MIKDILKDWIIMRDKVKDIRESSERPATRLQKNEEVVHTPPAANAGEKWEEHNSNLNRKFAQFYHAKFKGEDTKPHVDGIVRYVKNAPKGEIDIGHLTKLIDKQPKLRGRDDWNKGVNWSHRNEMLRPHIGDVTSFPELHEHYGGLPAVKAVLRMHGANGDPYMDNTSLFRSRDMHGDVMHTMNPSKGEWISQKRENENHWDEHEHTTSFTHSPRTDDPLHQKVVETFNDIMGGDFDFFDQDEQAKRQDAHDDAAAERGMAFLKGQYGWK